MSSPFLEQVYNEYQSSELMHLLDFNLDINIWQTVSQGVEAI